MATKDLTKTIRQFIKEQGLIAHKGKLYTKEQAIEIAKIEQEVLQTMIAVDKARGVKVEVLAIKPRKRGR